MLLHYFVLVFKDVKSNADVERSTVAREISKTPEQSLSSKVKVRSKGKTVGGNVMGSTGKIVGTIVSASKKKKKKAVSRSANP